MELNQLKRKFHSEDLEWRIQTSGLSGNSDPWAIVVPYVTNRAIMDRLDNVCGPQNWKNEFQPGPAGGVMCGISILCGDEWITKWDAAENSHIEPVKGGISGAMKRAAVQWGIGRYLYQFDVAFADIHPKGKHSGVAKDAYSDKKTRFRWDPPEIPEWAMTEEELGIRNLQRELRGLAQQYGGWNKVSVLPDIPSKPVSEWDEEDYIQAIRIVETELDAHN